MKVDMYMTLSHIEIMPFHKAGIYVNDIGKHMVIFTNRKIPDTMISRAGFTILELIISITILTFVALIIGQGFRIGANAWNKGEAETVETQKLRILSGMLTQQLKSFYLYRTKPDNMAKRSIVFKGENDSILFVTTLTDRTFGGLKWVRYSYKEGVLYYREGLLPDKDVMEKIEGDAEVLDSDIGEVLFEYYESKNDQWKNTWEDEDSIPDAVRVTLSYFQPFRINLMHDFSLKKDKEAG